MPDKITVYPPELASYEFTEETLARLVKSGVVRSYASGKYHYNRDEFTSELLEYLDGEIPSFTTMNATAKALACENGLFSNVAIVRDSDGGLKFCPASKFEDTDAWTIHAEYSSEHPDDMGFNDVTGAIEHAKSIGWIVAAVQE